jgi:hypothetical protein
MKAKEIPVHALDVRKVPQYEDGISYSKVVINRKRKSQFHGRQFSQLQLQFISRFALEAKGRNHCHGESRST